MKWKFLILAALLICSCDGSNHETLERTALLLKPGMNKSEVRQLFSDFKLSGDISKTFELQSATRFYTTNRQCASILVFGPKASLSLEVCGVYFDTNDIVMGYYYNLNN